MQRGSAPAPGSTRANHRAPFLPQAGGVQADREARQSGLRAVGMTALPACMAVRPLVVAPELGADEPQWLVREVKNRHLLSAVGVRLLARNPLAAQVQWFARSDLVVG